jgi:autotransporter passenger strand-loop-strand repeat protein
VVVERSHSTSGTTISSGGLQQDLGTAIGTKILNGGKEEVLSGGTAVDTVISGGMLEVADGSAVEGPVTFVNAGGILQLDASQNFPGFIVDGFASPKGVTEEIDLRDITFDKHTKLSFTEASNNLSGTLTVTDGTQIASLTLLGQYSTANFKLASDGSGGTIITDPPSVVGSAASPVLAAQHT